MVTVDARRGEEPALDALAAPTRPAPAASRWATRIRLALGLSPTLRTGLLLLPVGIALGPQGLGVLTPVALDTIDSVVPVAVAALGVLVGLDTRVASWRELRLFAAASLEAAVTLLVVASGAVALHLLTSSTGSPWMIALMLGLCAAPSATVVDSSDESASGGRVGDLDDVLPIVAGGALFAALGSGSWGGAIGRALQLAALSLMIAVATRLLVHGTTSAGERRVFTLGALLLLGGIAAYVSQSPLLAGLVAGVVWQAAGPFTREALTEDMRYLQHPLIALLLVIAGARIQGATSVVALAAVFLLCRIAGKLAGGALAGRVAAGSAPGPPLHFISPGVVGLATALSLLVSGAPGADTILSTVALGALATELVAVVVTRSGPRV